MTLRCPGGDTKQATEHTGLELRRSAGLKLKTDKAWKAWRWVGLPGKRVFHFYIKLLVDDLHEVMQDISQELEKESAAEK